MPAKTVDWLGFCSSAAFSVGTSKWMVCTCAQDGGSGAQEDGSVKMIVPIMRSGFEKRPWAAETQRTEEGLTVGNEEPPLKRAPL